jgi:hypothetical protein
VQHLVGRGPLAMGLQKERLIQFLKLEDIQIYTSCKTLNHTLITHTCLYVHEK